MTHDSDTRRPYAGVGISLDRKLSISALIVLTLQGGGFVWWAASTQAAVVQNTKDITTMAVDVRDARTKNTELLVKVARLEEKVERGNELLAQILQNLQSP